MIMIELNCKVGGFAYRTFQTLGDQHTSGEALPGISYRTIGLKPESESGVAAALDIVGSILIQQAQDKEEYV